MKAGFISNVFLQVKAGFISDVFLQVKAGFISDVFLSVEENSNSACDEEEMMYWSAMSVCVFTRNIQLFYMKWCIDQQWVCVFLQGTFNYFIWNDVLISNECVCFYKEHSTIFVHKARSATCRKKGKDIN